MQFKYGAVRCFKPFCISLLHIGLAATSVRWTCVTTFRREGNRQKPRWRNPKWHEASTHVNYSHCWGQMTISANMKALRNVIDNQLMESLHKWRLVPHEVLNVTRRSSRKFPSWNGTLSNADFWNGTPRGVFRTMSERRHDSEAKLSEALSGVCPFSPIVPTFSLRLRHIWNLFSVIHLSNYYFIRFISLSYLLFNHY